MLIMLIMLIILKMKVNEEFYELESDDDFDT